MFNFTNSSLQPSTPLFSLPLMPVNSDYTTFFQVPTVIFSLPGHSLCVGGPRNQPQVRWLPRRTYRIQNTVLLTASFIKAKGAKEKDTWGKVQRGSKLSRVSSQWRHTKCDLISPVISFNNTYTMLSTQKVHYSVPKALVTQAPST